MNREIVKLVRAGLYRDALVLHSRLHSDSVRPDKFTFPSLLKACGKLQAIPQGQILHTHLIKTGFQFDVYTATALSDMYMKLHLFDGALKVFDEIPEPNVASLNVAISVFLRNGYHKEAFRVFGHVSARNLRPDSVTMASLLSGCGGYVNDGLQFHCWALKLGVETDIYAATSLITMYMYSAELVSAKKVFKTVENKTVVCYNAFISGLLQNGVPHLALDVFKEMRELSTEEPNSVTLSSVVSSCSDLKDLRFGRQIHGFIVKIQTGFDTMVRTALVDMYSKCSRWQCAYNVFDEHTINRNLITWNSMIAGMMLNGQIEAALNLFVKLESEGLKPDSTTWNSMISGFSQSGKAAEAFIFFRKMQLAGEVPFLKCVTSLLPACSSLCALRIGNEIHGHVLRMSIGNDEFIITAIIDMYMKCAQSSSAQRIFDQIQMKSNDPAIWNAMISGYGRNGDNESAFVIFNLMMRSRVKPNLVTFNCILSVCSHTGEVEKGWNFFRMMNEDYGLNPSPDHVNCMVDLLGRSGQLDKARELLQEIDNPSASVFASMLGACDYYSNSKLGEEMAERLSELEQENTAPFVILSNIYAREGRWKDVERVREIMNERGLKKVPGFSLT